MCFLLKNSSVGHWWVVVMVPMQTKFENQPDAFLLGPSYPPQNLECFFVGEPQAKSRLVSRERQQAAGMVNQRPRRADRQRVR